MLEITLGPYRCPFRPWTPDQGRVFDGLFAYDTETTLIDDDRPYLVPSLVLATACDGHRGVFIPRQLVPAFFEAHAGLGFIAHNAAFDLKVTQAVLGDDLDLYALVEADKVWDTLVLKRLHSLATAGHTARGEGGLDDCARRPPRPGAAQGPQGRRGPRRPHRLRPLPGPAPRRDPRGLPPLRRRRPAGDLAPVLGAEPADQGASSGTPPGSGATSTTPGSGTRSAASAP